MVTTKRTMGGAVMMVLLFVLLLSPTVESAFSLSVCSLQRRHHHHHHQRLRTATTTHTSLCFSSSESPALHPHQLKNGTDGCGITATRRGEGGGTATTTTTAAAAAALTDTLEEKLASRSSRHSDDDDNDEVARLQRWLHESRQETKAVYQEWHAFHTERIVQNSKRIRTQLRGQWGQQTTATSSSNLNQLDDKQNPHSCIGKDDGIGSNASDALIAPPNTPKKEFQSFAAAAEDPDDNRLVPQRALQEVEKKWHWILADTEFYWTQRCESAVVKQRQIAALEMQAAQDRFDFALAVAESQWTVAHQELLTLRSQQQQQQQQQLFLGQSQQPESKTAPHSSSLSSTIKSTKSPCFVAWWRRIGSALRHFVPFRKSNRSVLNLHRHLFIHSSLQKQKHPFPTGEDTSWTDKENHPSI